MLIKSLWPNTSTDDNIIPKMSSTELVRGMFMLADLNTWAVNAVAHDNFVAKWAVGRARPEVRINSRFVYVIFFVLRGTFDVGKNISHSVRYYTKLILFSFSGSSV